MAIAPDEVDVLLFFKATLDAIIDSYKTTVAGWAEQPLNDTKEANLALDKKRILWVSRALTFIDPDEEFNLLDSSGHSTPSIQFEVSDTEATTNSVQGNMVYGFNEFNILIIVAKNNRPYTEYGRELSAIKDFILNGFLASTNKRILVESIAWSNFEVGEVPGCGCVIKVRTSINNYDYQIT